MGTYTYDDTLPTEKDSARAQLGAIPATPGDAATGLVSDEHIVVAINAAGALASGVAFLARELAVRFAQKPGSVRLPSGLSVSWPDRVKFWWSLADVADSEAGGARAGAPNSGDLQTTAPIAAPCGSPDANDAVYRGSPYQRRRWRP